MILLHLAGIRYSVIRFYSQQLIYNYLLQSKINLLNNIVFSRGARRKHVRFARRSKHDSVKSDILDIDDNVIVVSRAAIHVVPRYNSS